METIFKVGDKVFDYHYGWGIVNNIDNASKCLIEVEFVNGILDFYTKDGRSHQEAQSPTLSFTEYTLEGFSQKRPWEPQIPEIGEWAFFWDDNSTGAFWQRLQNKYGSGYTFKGALKVYSNCSKTPPPHLGGK